MNTIIINGQRIDVAGRHISIEDDVVKVDGQTIISGLSGITEIKFEGDLASLTCHNAQIFGQIQGDVNAHNIDCGNITGNVVAHNVDCGEINGNVTAKNVR